MFRTMIAATAFSAALAGPALAAPDTINISGGEIHGLVAGTVASFKGIPFAAPPVGDLRWRPPQPVKPWSGVREATSYGPACIQFGAGNVPVAGQSEDCLTLNVWKSADAAPGAKLPVMVWIFGGAFRTGSGSSPGYDGTQLAKQGVVLVTINYRVGRLGYFAHPALTAEHPNEPLGNFGLMDCLAALKWVQADIGAFGGDVKNVTVFGQSAGGETIHILMSMPASQGLFAKAIPESGFGRLKAVPVHGIGESYGQNFAETVGIRGTGPDAAKAPRALSVAQITADANAPGGQGRPMRPMIDGVLMIETPQQAFAAGHELRIPYITGGVSYESSLNPAVGDNPEPTLARAGAFRDKLLALYGGDPGGAALDFVTETGIIEPARYLARQHSQNGQKTWLYYGSYLSESQRGKVHGLSHGGEIKYVFGNLSDQPVERNGRVTPAATPEDWAISKAMMAYWVAFAKTGDPNNAGDPKWPAYDARTDTLMEFGNDGVQIRQQFHKASLDLIEQINTASATAP
jgi:para-nitrobenzyl esterase